MASLPIVLCIDIEPDRRMLSRRGAEPLLGFEKLMTLLPGLRDRIAAATGVAPLFTWFLRMDPQIADVYGSPTALAEHYERELAELMAAGDEMAVHAHAWRWTGYWVNDHADWAWVNHSADIALDAFAQAYGSPATAFRYGVNYMSGPLARHLDDVGVAVDITIDPGRRATRSLVPSEPATGFIPDTRTAPAFAYRPSRDDYLAPDFSRTSGLVFLPHSIGVSLSLRPIGDRLIPTGEYETLEPWLAPDSFREMLAIRLAAPNLTHLAFGLRTDIGLLTDQWAATEANLVEVATQVLDGQWCTATAAVEQLSERLGPPTDLDETRAPYWLLGRNDPGYRENVQLETLELTDGSVIPVVVASAHRPLLVSAILPVFNAGSHLVDSVQSVVNQEQPPDELIVVDDGSDDVSGLAVLETVSAPFPIRVLHQSNAGQSAARNRGAAAARGDLLAFLDQDDIWHPRHLALLCAALVENPDVQWSYGDYDEIDVDGHVVTRAMLRQRQVEHPKVLLSQCVDHDLMVVPSSSVIRRSAFEAIGGFDEALRGYEDDDLYVRAFRAGWGFEFTEEPLTAFRVHATSGSTSIDFAESRLRYSEKLRSEIVDDPRTHRYYYRDFVAPRFFWTSLDDYVRAVSVRDWVTAKRARDAVMRFGRIPLHPARLRLTLIRNPRVFRFLLRLNDALPARVRPANNPILGLR
jgi:glycosyltransferase involved in cell wall biosynthesis